MAKSRYINTKFWSDNFIREQLNPLDRYLFLYFLTNEKTNIAGVYELPLGTIAFETGIDKEDLTRSMLPRLEPKVIYIDGWVIIPNFVKHQSTTSKTVQKGIEVEMEKVPKEIIEKLVKRYGMDRVSIWYPYLIIYLNSNFNSNSNSNSNFNSNSETDNPSDAIASDPTPSDEAKQFFLMVQENGEALEAKVQEVSAFMKILPEVVKREYQKFTLYWTEPNKTGKKQRWQLEDTFEVKRRLITWFGNNKNFKQPNQNFNNSKGKEIIA